MAHKGDNNMKKTTLIYSTPNGKSDLEKMINEYFYSENYIITEDNRIYNKKLDKYLTKYIVQEKKGRWQFRRIN